MLKYKALLFLLILSVTTLYAETESSYKFRIMLKDKGTPSFSTENPSAFLTERAIQRRIRQYIPIDEADLPISEQYISQIENLGCEVAAKSKWLKTITVHTEDSTVVELIKDLSFVEDAVCVWKSTGNTRSAKSSSQLHKVESPADFYGPAYSQIAIHNGDSLHRAGYKGSGMEIAVIDAGFKLFDENVLLENINLKGRKDFIHKADNSNENEHGLRVLSCMAGNLPHIFVGTAPEAGYWLFQSENPTTEYPIEEDYWVAAAEYADSVGVDIINTSLGYTRFDDATMDYTTEQIDGKTMFITRGANMASQKGMLVVCSAGNEGNKTWKYISAPADSEEILTVGAIRADSTLAAFSSRGPTADLRIKPDVVAVGQNTAVITSGNYTATDSGTSFSSPVMCGLVACLWQAFPTLTNKELIQVIRESSDRLTPDNDFGYGIPDMVKAMRIAKSEATSIQEEKALSKKKFRIFTNSTGELVITNTNLPEDGTVYSIKIISIDGKTVLSDAFKGREKTYQLNPSKGSFYLINIRSTDFIETQKVFF